MANAALAQQDFALAQGCAICQTADYDYAFTIKGREFLRCQCCRTIFPAPQQQGALAGLEPGEGYDARTIAQALIETLRDRQATGPYEVIVADGHPLIAELRSHLPADTEFHAHGQTPRAGTPLGTILMLAPLTLIDAPRAFLKELGQRLLPGGHLILLQPMQDSRQARWLGRNWLEWQQPHAFYVTRDTLHIALLNGGFDRVWFRRARHRYSLAYLQQRLRNVRAGALLRLIERASGILPGFMKQWRFKLPSGHVIASCQIAPARAHPVLSIIMPVFNEMNTFTEVMRQLLAKQVNGLRKQIIIVESNSTDGTRELVKAYEGHPEVKIIWQEQPRGKGFAVREGLAAASGDYVLIQDADLEYDLNDYEGLLEPLRSNQAMFVLGSRHRGHWKMREFNDAPVVAAVFNIGHVFFTSFVNLLTGQRMTDPFTMFKVLRRDAFFGLHFICRRFDFDHEMVIKLIRKGYQPLELPVNYRARSFAEGKKVSFVKDGLTWLWTDLKLRYGRLGIWRD